MDVTLDTTMNSDQSASRHALKQLRETITSVTGLIFYGPLLRSARSSSLKGTIGHGGHGEDVFQGQLDQILAEKVGEASSNSLNDVLFDRFAAAAVANSRRSRVQ